MFLEIFGLIYSISWASQHLWTLQNLQFQDSCKVKKDLVNLLYMKAQVGKLFPQANFIISFDLHVLLL